MTTALRRPPPDKVAGFSRDPPAIYRTACRPPIQWTCQSSGHKRNSPEAQKAQVKYAILRRPPWSALPRHTGGGQTIEQ